MFSGIGFVLLATLGIGAQAPQVVVGPDGIIAGKARFQVLSDKLLRLEYSPSGTFTNVPTAVVCNRIKPVSPTVKTSGNWVTIRSGGYTIKYKLGSDFKPGNLKVSWKGGSWQPGQKDPLNLGGTPEALDGVYRDYLPSIGEGPLSRSGYWLYDDTNTPLIDPATDWLKEKPKPRSTDQYLFVYGKDYKGALKEYTRLLGSVPKVPKYALGCWYSRYWDYKDYELKEIVSEFKKRNAPLSVLVVDVDWHKYGWEGYDWNTDSFPDPDGFMKWAKDAGVRLTLNTHPSTIVAADSHTPKVREYVGLPPANEDYEFNFVRKLDAEAFNKICLNPLIERGISFWWIDGHKSYMDGLNSHFWTNKIYYEPQEKATGIRSMVFDRYGQTGSHRYPLGFSGDTMATWETLQYETGMTGRAGNVLWQWSHDIGGFHGDKIEDELIARWAQFGAFTPVFRLHSNHGERLPWKYEPRTEKIMLDAMRLHQSLIPYVYSLQQELVEDSVPIYRPVYLEYPKDANTYQHLYEYMIGPSLLVAPASERTVDGATNVPVYLPKGQWMDYFTGKPYTGGRAFIEKAELEKIPAYVKAGSIIPTKEPDFDGITLRVYRGASESTTLVEDDGLSLDYRKGQVAKTKVALIDHKDGFGLKIYPPKGSYVGMPKERRFRLRLFGVLPQNDFIINGRAIDRELVKSVDLKTGEVILDLSKEMRAVSEPMTVEIFSPNSFAKYLQFRNASELLDRLDTLTSQMPYLKPSIAAGRDKLTGWTKGTNIALNPRTFLLSTFALARKNGATDDQLKQIVGLTERADIELLKAFHFGDTVSAYASLDENLAGIPVSVTLDPPKGYVTTRVYQASGFGRWQIEEPKESPIDDFVAQFNISATIGGYPLKSSKQIVWSNAYVTKWRVLGPFGGLNPEKDEIDLSSSGLLDFGAVYQGLDGQTKWRDMVPDMKAWKLTEPRLVNFRKLWGQDQCHAYAATYLYSPNDRDVRLDIGSDDTCCVWLNRKVIDKFTNPRPALPGDDKIKVRLNKGWNEVVVRVGNTAGNWGFLFEVRTPDSKPDKEVKASPTMGR